MKPLKIEIDRPTLACLIESFSNCPLLELDSKSTQNAVYLAVYYLLEEMFSDLAQRPKSDYYGVKLSLPKALAFRYLAFYTIPSDEWTNAMLVEFAGKLDNYIHNNRVIATALNNAGLGDGTLKLN